MKKILIFVSSGLSTRMGGFPKGLSEVGGTTVLAHAIRIAEPYYDKIYVICNFTTEPKFSKLLGEENLPVKLRPIITGKGDAESVLKSIKLVKKELSGDFDCTFCWGDAFFTSSVPFQTMMSVDLSSSTPLWVGCSVDKDPYAYFDIQTENGNLLGAKIIKSYFKKRDGCVPVGIHDQCIFRCQTDIFLEMLALYQKELGFNGSDYLKSATNEMGLLNSFTFAATINRPARIILMPSGLVHSFNTPEELNGIISKETLA